MAKKKNQQEKKKDDKLMKTAKPPPKVGKKRDTDPYRCSLHHLCKLAAKLRC